MYYTIYKITNNVNGKIYIGKHQTKNPMDGYYGSGKLIREAIKKYGKENFTKEVLFLFDSEQEMNQKEKELITEEFVSRNDTYNAGVGGEGGPHFKGRSHGSYMKDLNESKEHREKISEGLKQYYSSNPKREVKHTDKFKQKVAASRRGKTMSEETKAKIAASLRGKKHSEETKEKMRKAKLEQSLGP